MATKEMRKLNRADLLRIVVRQQETIERLEAENSRLQKQLDDRTLICAKAGSIAQAALEINKIFEIAQQTADEYINSVRAMNTIPPEEGENNE